MNNYYIVNQSQILIYDHVIDHVEVSETYPSNNHVEISEAQYQFYLDHPTASMQEVWNMELTPPYIQTNEDISRQRQEAYKQRSDSYYMAYQKYTVMGQLDKAEISKTQWLAEVAAIDLENPYL